MAYKDQEKKKQYNLEYRLAHQDELNEYYREYYKKNKARKAENCKRWRAAKKAENPDFRKEEHKRYRDSHKEQIRAYDKRYDDAHPIEHRERVRRYTRNHPDRIAVYAKKYRQEHRDLYYYHANKRRLLEKGNGGSHTYTEWTKLKESYGNICLRCGKSLRLSQDHVVPVTKFGRDDIENIQPLCHKCNRVKFNRTFDYRLERAIDEAKLMQSHHGKYELPKSYEDRPWWNLWENARYETPKPTRD